MLLKWLVLILIVIGVWYGFKAITRRNKARQVEAARRRREGIKDMRACTVCDTYVPTEQSDCGRDGCPYSG